MFNEATFREILLSHRWARYMIISYIFNENMQNWTETTEFAEIGEKLHNDDDDGRKSDEFV